MAAESELATCWSGSPPPPRLQKWESLSCSVPARSSWQCRHARQPCRHTAGLGFQQHSVSARANHRPAVVRIAAGCSRQAPGSHMLCPDRVLPAVLQEVLARISAQLKDHVLMLSLQMYGCRVIQKALEVSCEGHLPSLAPSQYRLTSMVLQLCWPAMSSLYLVRRSSCLQRSPAGAVRADCRVATAISRSWAC